jgi:hypothetical protein
MTGNAIPDRAQPLWAEAGHLNICRAPLKISLLREIEHCTRISYIGGTGFLARADRLESLSH